MTLPRDLTDLVEHRFDAVRRLVYALEYLRQMHTEARQHEGVRDPMQGHVAEPPQAADQQEQAQPEAQLEAAFQGVQGHVTGTRIPGRVA